jgi:phospholipid/cholesterol/gamma-HCH transport system ATP-binding protein
VDRPPDVEDHGHRQDEEAAPREAGLTGGCTFTAHAGVGCRVAARPSDEARARRIRYSPRPRMSPSPLIHFKDVRKAFGPKVIYDGLDFAIARGETVTVLGPSGSGKSVMLKMLIGLLEVDSGEILLDGKDVTRMTERELYGVRRRVAYLFQGAALFDSLTVGENVAYGLREQNWNTMSDEEIAHRVAQSLESVGLPGIEEMRPSDLSGGMKKRVGLARTLALQPEVLLYDEPTTGLDPINTARINNLIRGIKRALGLTSVVVTHDMGTAFSVSDRIVMIGKGRLIMQGTPDDFRQTRDPYVRDFIDGKAPEVEDVSVLLSTS